MASFSERIKIIIDVVTDGATTGLGNFKKSVQEAEGVGGKFKAGMSSAFDTVKQNAGALALGAGAALIGFGIKAVGAFDEVAKKAIDMAAATGLSVEQSSRWIAVADDLGISAESVSKSFLAIIKNMDKGKWDEYGIATHDAGGNIKDTNTIMLDAFDTLAKIPAGSARAKAGNDLFGRSYADLSPLIGKSRAEMEKYLGSVEKGQVVTDAEAAKAKKMMLAQDNLKDSINEVTLAVGGMVAELAPMINQTAGAVTKLIGFADAADHATEKIGGLKGALDIIAVPGIGLFNAAMKASSSVVKDDYTKSLDELVQRYKDVGYGADVLAEVTQRWYDANKLLNPAISETDRETRKLASGMGELSDKEGDAANAALAYQNQVDLTTSQVRRDVDAMKAKWDELHGKISNEQAMIHYRQQIEDVKQANIDAWTITKEKGPGSPESIAAIDNARLKTLDLENTTADLGSTILGLPPEQVTKLIAKIDRGDLDNLAGEVQGDLDTRNFRIAAHLDNISVDGGTTFTGETHAAGATFGRISVIGRQKTATGGIFKARPGGYDINIAEAGRDEAVVPLDGQHGIGGDTINYYMTLPPGMDPEAVAAATRTYRRRGGR